jgi:uncharacterized membrane protein YdjX (TVP38/TMEM64 family)
MTSFELTWTGCRHVAEEIPVSPHQPSLDEFVFENDETPLLLRPKTIGILVIAFVGLIAAYAIAGGLLGLSWNIDAAPFRDWVDGFGPWGPLMFIAAMALSVLFAPIPNAPIFIAAGLAWGPIEGTAYSLIGLLIGSTMAFYASRWLGRRHLPRLVGHKAANHLDRLADTMGGTLIFWLRMLPAVNFDWISFAAGMTSMRFSVFIIFSALGMVLPTAITVAAGDGLGHDLRITFVMAGIWVFGIAMSAVFFWWRRRRWQARRAAEQSRVAEATAAEFRTPV